MISHLVILVECYINGNKLKLKSSVSFTPVLYPDSIGDAIEFYEYG